MTRGRTRHRRVRASARHSASRKPGWGDTGVGEGRKAWPQAVRTACEQRAGAGRRAAAGPGEGGQGKAPSTSFSLSTQLAVWSPKSSLLFTRLIFPSRCRPASPNMAPLTPADAPAWAGSPGAPPTHVALPTGLSSAEESRSLTLPRARTPFPLRSLPQYSNWDFYSDFLHHTTQTLIINYDQLI